MYALKLRAITHTIYTPDYDCSRTIIPVMEREFLLVFLIQSVAILMN